MQIIDVSAEGLMKMSMCQWLEHKARPMHCQLTAPGLQLFLSIEWPGWRDTHGRSDPHVVALKWPQR